MDWAHWLAWATISAIAIGMAVIIWRLCDELERTRQDLEMERDIAGRAIDIKTHEVHLLEDELRHARAVSFKFELELHKAKTAVSKIGWSKHWN